MQKTNGTLRSIAGLRCGSWRRRTATCDHKRSASARRRSCASSTPNGAGVSGDTHHPPRMSPKGWFLQGNRPTPEKHTEEVSFNPSAGGDEEGLSVNGSNVYMFGGMYVPLLLRVTSWVHSGMPVWFSWRVWMCDCTVWLQLWLLPSEVLPSCSGLQRPPVLQRSPTSLP